MSGLGIIVKLDLRLRVVSLVEWVCGGLDL